MGWKNVKEHYAIKHHVQVRNGRICIGSGHMPEIIVIDDKGRLTMEVDSINDDIKRVDSAMLADPAKLVELINTPDVFTKSIPVYSYAGAEIIEYKCEELGWPNVTHDGAMMYENMYSGDKAIAVDFATRNASAGVQLAERRIKSLQLELQEAETTLATAQAELDALNCAYPSASE